MIFSDDDRKFMRLAIEEAACDPREFKVGAVLVRSGREIARAHGGEDPEQKQHAELLAIRKAASAHVDLTDATLYTTLEPCVPDVRKPDRQPCATAILNEAIR